MKRYPSSANTSTWSRTPEHGAVLVPGDRGYVPPAPPRPTVYSVHSDASGMQSEDSYSPPVRDGSVKYEQDSAPYDPEPIPSISVHSSEPDIRPDATYETSKFAQMDRIQRLRSPYELSLESRLRAAEQREHARWVENTKLRRMMTEIEYRARTVHRRSKRARDEAVAGNSEFMVRLVAAMLPQSTTRNADLLEHAAYDALWLAEQNRDDYAFLLSRVLWDKPVIAPRGFAEWSRGAFVEACDRLKQVGFRMEGGRQGPSGNEQLIETEAPADRDRRLFMEQASIAHPPKPRGRPKKNVKFQ